MTDFQRTILAEINRLRASRGQWPLARDAAFTHRQFTSACDAHLSRVGPAVRAFREREAQRAIAELPYAHIT